MLAPIHILFCPAAMASPDNTQSISGRVTDQAGQGLAGVSVLLKGTANRTLTDSDGNYELALPKTTKAASKAAELIISHTGYSTQTVPVQGRRALDLRLTTDAPDAEEIVVVGYGSKEKTVVSGSIAQASGTEILASPSANLGPSLAGRLPGVTINQRSGEPGHDGVSILVRGHNSIGNNSALIVVDGVPGRDWLDRLDPNDIESITLLKDASAAIYGARAAGGVILVTTKRGALGQPRITFNYNHGFVTPTRLPTMADSYSLALATNVFDVESGQPPTHSPDDLQKFLDGSSPLTHPNTDWYDHLFKDISHQSRQSLQLVGGTEDLKYFLSLGRSQQDGLYTGGVTKFTQYNLRSKIDTRITDDLRISGDVAARRENGITTGRSPWFIFWMTHRQPSTDLAVFPDGSYSQGLGGINPLAVVRESGYRKRQANILQTTLRFDYTIPGLTGLSLDGFLAADSWNSFSKDWSTPWDYSTYDPTANTYTTYQSSYQDTISLNEYTSRSYSITPNVKLNYANTFGAHDVSGFIAYEQRTGNGSWNHVGRNKFATESIQQISAGSADPSESRTRGSASKSARQNYFGRASYTYAKKYIVDATARLDGSSNFPEGGRFGFFPGASAAWRISEEPFMRAVPLIDELKLRTSYGQLGNDRVTPFLHLQTYTPTTAFVTGTGQLLSGIRPKGAPVSGVTWETTETMNLGLDTSLLDGRVTVTLDAFRSTTTDMLIARQDSVPALAGIGTLPPENAGTMQNKGIEALVSYGDSIRDFVFNVSANFSFARNKVTFIDEAFNETAPWQSKTGRRHGTGLYYDAIGIYRTEADLLQYPAKLPGSALGDLILRDVNGDGEITGLDRIPIALNSVPEISFGVNFSASFRGFDLSALLQGQARAIRSVGLKPTRGESIYQWQTDYWTPDFPNAAFPDITNEANYQHNSTFWLRSAAFIRLKTLEIGYTLPDTIADMLGLGKTRVYASVFNMFTLSGIKDLDPESTGATQHPQTRVVNLGIRASNF
ncbi:MAG: TonB-dependent receptor [Proteobacteria bacterium]|nr:TonB-dependent receptor [Pseudomonadota bacterium]